MKIVVIGGTGLIGSKVGSKLREHGHEAIAASPNSGVNTASLIQTRLTLGRKSARKHCFRAIAHDSARPVSKLGSLIPQHKRLREDRLRAEQELVRHYA
jgi:nucleoside-diphosphate-sugar epimerase